MEEIFRGETSHVLRLRGQDHAASYRKIEDKSVFWAHAKEHHKGRLDVKYEMKVHKTWDTGLSRQVGEAVLIKRMEEDIKINVLNQKGEFPWCHITRLECPEAVGNNVKITERGCGGKEPEPEIDLSSNVKCDGRQGVFQYFHDLNDDFDDNKTKTKPNGKLSK